MGVKMVGLKKGFPKTVQLILTGPKSILMDTMLVDASLGQSWYELLRGELNLEIDPNSGIFACSLNYTPSAPKSGRGWRSELNEEIRDYISKFERKRKQYAVRLCHPDNLCCSRNNSVNGISPKQMRSNSLSDGNRASSRRPRKSTLRKRRPNLSVSTQGQLSQATVAPASNSSDANGNCETPRYHNGGGIQNGPGSQHQVNGTRRQKRRHKQQTLEETNLGASGQIKHPVKQRRLQENSNLTAQNTQSQCKLGGERKDGEKDPFPIPQYASIKLEFEEPEEVEVEVDVANGTWDQEDWDAATGEEDNGVNRNSDQSSDTDDFDDDNSLCTAATAEENELRREGIHVEDVKSLAEERMGRFSNAYMLRVRNEISKLKKNHLWDRNVNRAPLSCYLLQEIFK